ncbi:MAG: acyl-CoA dehydrogenase family protein [Candidatus Krumholzibacteria bacterium]|nr:acyl-CoA dehydrogenase family protein [Candidatus Krumholzibacteria bacterium]MDH5271275.1 acyl-CoA dehydrogenase family protein [Candidatus Krumholzibacteria bacterium]
MKTDSTSIRKGGSFLVEGTNPADIFTPEDFSDEQKMFVKTADDFVNNEVLPNIEKTEAKEEGAMVALLKKAGELGLLMIDIPEAYGGLGLDKATSMAVIEAISRGGAFATTYGGHAGIGTLPLILFGTDAQKQKYLAPIATADLMSCYALTEPGSGSDALAARTRADLSKDGKHYVLNGDKVFITNGGFADVFIVFAKVDGDKFSAFILERGYEGLKTGLEEKKMGIKGSSTVQVFMENVKVPVENLLGEIGKGHKIAFNILNVGRFKLGVGCVGAAKIAFDDAIKYANERHQFGKPISSFGMIQAKIANMASRMYAVESMSYRTAGLMDGILANVPKDDPDYAQKSMAGIEEYVAECSIMKIKGSEMLDYVVDETVQIFGGYGFIADYPAERHYRDSRVARIYEGTNEINRMLLTGNLLKRSVKGELPLLAAAKKLSEELLEGMPSLGDDEEATLLSVEKGLIDNAKKLSLLALGVAAQKFGAKVEQEQQVLGDIADIFIETYGMESSYLRTMKLVAASGEDACKPHIAMTRLYVNEAMGRLDLWARELLAACAEGDELRTMLAASRRLTKYTPIDSIHLREEIAKGFTEKGKWEL